MDEVNVTEIDIDIEDNGANFKVCIASIKRPQKFKRCRPGRGETIEQAIVDLKDNLERFKKGAKNVS